MATADLTTEINDYLSANYMPPAQTWLSSFIETVRTNTPLPALKKTALFRIQTADLTQAVDPETSDNLFPQDVASPERKEMTLVGPITVQVLDVEDVGRSRWSQVELLEAQERGEMTKGREIIRVPVEDADEGSSIQDAGSASRTAAHGPHKLLLQDAHGVKVYAFEMQTVPGINLQMSIGSKLLLRNVILARGLLLLTPDTIEILGGKVESWDKEWRKGLLERLRASARAEQE